MPAPSDALAGVTIRPAPGGCRIPVHLQPRAASDGLVGVHGTALKVRVTAPPVAGRANAALVQVLAAALGVAPGAVAVTTGQRGRDKAVTVTGLSPDEAGTRLREALTATGQP